MNPNAETQIGLKGEKAPFKTIIGQEYIRASFLVGRFEMECGIWSKKWSEERAKGYKYRYIDRGWHFEESILYSYE